MTSVPRAIAGILLTLAALGMWPALVIAAPAKDTLSTTIVSFNIRYGTADDGLNSWPNRRDLVFKTIASYEPAIFGVQECLLDQADQLRAAFPAYQMTGAGRDDGKKAGEMCAVFTDTVRYEILDHGVFWLSPTPDVPGSKGWDAALPRIATWLKLHDRRCVPDTMFIFNTHFDHMGEQARLESAVVLQQHITEIAGPYAVILMGDFNSSATGSSPPYQLLKRERAGQAVALRDTWNQASREQRMRGEGTFHGFKGEATRGRIDWILSSEHWHCVDAGIDRTQENGRYPSDHFPVWAIFRLECRVSAIK